MSYATNNKSFGSRLTANNEVHKLIDYILEDIFVLFYQSHLCIEASTG